MKKIIILTVLTCQIIIAYSQDEMIKSIQKLTLENDSLKKEILKQKNDIDIKEATLFKVIENNGNEKSTLSIKITDLEKEIESLKNQIVKLDKKNIASLENQITQKSDSIILQKTLLQKKEEEVANSKNQCFISEERKFNEGKLSVINQISLKYTTKNFDDLIFLSSKQSLQTDLELIGNNDVAEGKIKNLLSYFEATSILDKKLNSIDISVSLNKLKGINEKSSLLANSKTTIENYGLVNDALKSTINKIIDWDKKFQVYTEDERKDKFKDILGDLSWFIRNYRFNFKDYPYLTEIVLEIIDKKQKDVNADVSDLLKKL